MNNPTLPKGARKAYNSRLGVRGVRAFRNVTTQKWSDSMGLSDHPWACLMGSK
jgi:hypothetical protein